MKLKPLAFLAVFMAGLAIAEVANLVLKANYADAADDAAAEPSDANGEAKNNEVASETNSVDQATNALTAPITTAPTCVPIDLAKEAGISPAEYRLLQALQERRQQLDDRQNNIITREAVVKTAEDIVLQRLNTMQQVQNNIEKLLGQVDELEAKRLANLVGVYEKMKPKDAAIVMEGLSDEVLVAIASRMKNQALSAIMNKMNPVRARELTALLAEIDVARAYDATDSTTNNAAASTPTSPAAAPKKTAQNSTPNGSNANDALNSAVNRAANPKPDTAAKTNAAPTNATQPANANPAQAGGAKKGG